jgi:uncharacterized C2H2 Zn-finger protein
MDTSFRPSEPIYTDHETLRQYKAPMPKEIDIAQMLEFFGIDQDEILKCPECDLHVRMRTLLPHLNNTAHGYYMDELENPNPIDMNNLRRYDDHGWTFKQMGEWLASLGY